MAFKCAIRPSLRQSLKAIQLRSFSVSSKRGAQWGFIGLGQMGNALFSSTMSVPNIPIGYNMARNLQSNLPSTDSLLIYDVNAEATKVFVEEKQQPSGGPIVKVACGVREAVENSVSSPFILLCLDPPTIP
jgi:3-hydroxyisobutyrate dehydrogenase